MSPASLTITGLTIRSAVPLGPLTSWKVGGAARWWCEAGAEQLPELMARCSRAGIPVHILGRGSNVLVADDGIDGLVVSTRDGLGQMLRIEDTLVAEAGVSLPSLARAAAKDGFAGFEFLVGIPGSVGGGLVMNAGIGAQPGKELGMLLRWVEMVGRDGAVRRIDDPATLAFGYRTSRLQRNGWLVLRAGFALDQPGDPADIAETMRQHVRDRRRRQPLTWPTAGSTFKQPAGGRPAGWYIDRADMKGYRIGGARISLTHANWIENTGTARASDIVAVMAEVQERVLARFGIALEPEVQMLNRPLWSDGDGGLT